MKRLILAILFLSSYAHADSLSAIHENNVGKSQLKDERAREAETTFLKALTDDPFNPVIRYNLGTAYLVQKKYDRAVKEYQTLLRQPNLDPELAFYANFNAAWAAAEQKNVDLALEYYQKALDIKPDSHETKVNIELLTSAKSGQNQQGQGQGQGQDPNQQQGQGQGQQPDQQPKNSDDQQKNKPKNGQNFSKDELKKIFEELERQEQKVRSLEYGTKGSRDKGPAKDW